MSTSPTLQLDDEDSLTDHPPIDESHTNSFDSLELTNEQIQGIFDQPTLVTNSTEMDGSTHVECPSSPARVDNFAAPRTKKKRKVSRQRVSYSKKKLLVGSDFYRAVHHEGPMSGIGGQGLLVGIIQECPRGANNNHFRIEWMISGRQRLVASEFQSFFPGTDAIKERLQEFTKLEGETLWTRQTGRRTLRSGHPIIAELQAKYGLASKRRKTTGEDDTTANW
jgi:hypothetical protein